MVLALILAIVASILPFLSRKIRRDSRLTQICLALVVLRQTVSILQVYTGGLPTVDSDPIEFQLQAEERGGPLTRHPYGRFLVLIYSLFGSSHLLGCELSQVAFSLSLLLFVELIYLLDMQAHAGRLVLIFGCLPSCLLNTSVTLREPFQVLGFLGLSLGILKFVTRGVDRFTLLIPACSVLLVALHQGFTVYILVALPLTALYLARHRPKLLFGGALVMLLGGLLVGGRAWEFLRSDSTVLQRIEQGQGLEYIDGYQESVESGRTTFGTLLDASSFSGLVRTGPVVLANYLFAPFPWQVRGAKDVYGLLECAIRLYLFLSALHRLFTAREKKVAIRLAFAMFFTMELIWAAGTANWGTAFRHRVVAWGLLVLLGGARSGTSGEQEEQVRPSRSATSLRASIRERRRKRSDAGRAQRFSDAPRRGGRRRVGRD